MVHEVRVGARVGIWRPGPGYCAVQPLALGAQGLAPMRSGCWKGSRWDAQCGSAWNGESDCVGPSFSRTDSSSRKLLFCWHRSYTSLWWCTSSVSCLHLHVHTESPVRRGRWDMRRWDMRLSSLKGSRCRQRVMTNSGKLSVKRSVFSAQTGVFTGNSCLCYSVFANESLIDFLF